MTQSSKIQLQMSGMEATLALLGANEKNRSLVENELDVRLSLRGGEMQIEGQEQNVEWARQVMEKLLELEGILRKEQR